MARYFAMEKNLLKQYAMGSLSKNQADLLYTRIKNDVENIVSESSFESPHFRLIIITANEQMNRSTTSSGLKILISVLRTRGLLRWLSLNLFSTEINGLEQSYYLSRTELMVKLVKNFSAVLRIIRNHLRYSTIKDGTGLLPRIELNDYVRAMSVGKIQLSKESVLSSNLKSDFKLKFKNANSSLLATLVRKDSISTVFFLLEYGPDDSILSWLQKHFPDGMRFLETRTMFKTKRLPNSDKIFDEISHLPGSELQGDVLENVEIWHQRFLIQKDYLLEFDSTGSHLLPFVAGHWQYMRASRLSPEMALLEKPAMEIDEMSEAIFLSGRADENWYHLLLDTLPRYMFLKNLSQSIPVLIRDDLPPTSLEFLTLLIDRPIIQLPSNSRLSVKQLHFLAARSTVFDSEQQNSDHRVQFSPILIEAMVKHIKDKVDANPLGTSLDYSFFKRRSRQRRILNSSRLELKTQKLGFRTVEDNVDLYRSQVRIFSNLACGVSPGGAILANIIFMPVGSTMVCLRSSRLNDLELWKKLALAVGINYFEVVGIPTYFGKDALKRDHSNFYISPRKLRRILGKAMQSKT